MAMRHAVQLSGLFACFLIGACSRSASPDQDCLRTLSGHSNSVCAVVFNPDGTQLVSGSADGKIKIWDTETGQCQRTLDGHTDWIHSVAMSSDGRFFASAGRDKLVKLWDVESGEQLKTFVGHRGIITSVAYSPDGRFLASCGKARPSRFGRLRQAAASRIWKAMAPSRRRRSFSVCVVNGCFSQETRLSCGTSRPAPACVASRAILIRSEQPRSAGTTSGSRLRDRLPTTR
jgi:hypothetical protein